MELLLQKLGLRVTHVPYKGAAPAMTDLLGGQVSLKMDTILSSTPHIASGKIKPLALASLRRSPLLPDVPTVAESGIPGYQGILWMGILVPSQTPKDIVNTLHKALVAAVRTPALVRRFEADGVLPVGSEPAEFERLIASEIRQWGELIQRAKIKAD